MQTGMLWFDDSKIPLQNKIEKAIAYYFKKYERLPDLCLVHPNMLKDENLEVAITVRPYRPVLPGHIWIGIDEPTPKG